MVDFKKIGIICSFIGGFIFLGIYIYKNITGENETIFLLFGTCFMMLAIALQQQNSNNKVDDNDNDKTQSK